jgi:hypothetical protein
VIPEGEGIEYAPSKEKIKGEYDEKYTDQPSFVLDYPNGSKYFGSIVDPRRHGKGTMWYGKHYKYIGDWKDGRRHGRGALYYLDEAVYEGCWVNDEFDGVGVMKFQALPVRRVVGSSAGGANDNLHEDLTQAFDQGIVHLYEGEFREGKMHGSGTLHLKDGSTFKGIFVKGIAMGRGTFKYAKGSKEVSGTWAKNKLIKQ